MKKGICVVGPTAGGKSNLAILLAQKYGGEIVSADSMQLYRKMNIGTAKPSLEELETVPHHMVDILDIDEEFSVSEYVKRAKICVDGILERKKLPILCGGTGLYVDSFVNETVFCEYDITEDARTFVAAILQNEGNVKLWETLSELDKECAQNIHPSNIKRVVRALEIFYSTGVTMTEWNRRSVPEKKEYDFLMLGIAYKDRECLYERINRRVDLMLDQGLEDEAKKLFDAGLLASKTASQAIGYKEFLDYFAGNGTLSDAAEKIKLESRRYAKRQLTWFKRNENIKWIYADGKTPEFVFEKACEFADEFLK